MAADALAAAASWNRHRESTLAEMPAGRALVICIVVSIFIIASGIFFPSFKQFRKKSPKIKIIF